MFPPAPASFSTDLYFTVQSALDQADRLVKYTENMVTGGGRWELGWSERDSSVDRLGNHTAARYRYFMQLVEKEQLEVDPALFGLLLGAERLLNEMEMYERASPHERLAQTGHYVRKLQQMNSLLDAAVSMCGVSEPVNLVGPGWAMTLEQERSDLVARFSGCIEQFATELVTNSNDRDSSDDKEMNGVAKVEEALMMLKYNIEMYADDTLTEGEIKVATEVFTAISEAYNTVVLTLPEWFAPQFEFGGTYGFSRWGNDLHFPVYSTCGRAIESFVKEAAIWSGLNHPHIVKFIGACHIGERPFFAHEKVRTLSEYLSENRKRNVVWCRLREIALGLQYLHERGLGGCVLSIDTIHCAELEEKAMLMGIGISPPDSLATANNSSGLSNMIGADMRAFGFCILDAFKTVHEGSSRVPDDDVGKPEDVPTGERKIPHGKPDYLFEREWDLVVELIQSRLDFPFGHFGVIEHLREFAELDTCSWVDEYGIFATNRGCKPIEDVGNVWIPLLAQTAGDVKYTCAKMAEGEQIATRVLERINDLFSQYQKSSPGGTAQPISVKVAAHICTVLSGLYYFLDQSASSSASCQSGLSRRQPATIFRLQTQLDRLIKLHGLSLTNPVHLWQPEWKDLYPGGQMSQLCGRHKGDAETAAALEEFELRYNRPGFTSTWLPRWFVPPHEVEFRGSQFVGQGSFGEVLRGKWFETDVAVKRVFIDNTTTNQVREQFRKEANVWDGLNHINVIKMYGACHVDQPFFLCEYANGGTIDQYIKKEGSDRYLIWYSLLNAALGLQYLHDSGVVHGDLKANNILVGADGIAKLADFGLSDMVRKSIMNSGGGAKGAYRWKAPECIPFDGVEGEAATFASDVYSFAMSIIEVATGEVPWGSLDDNKVRYNMKKGELPLWPENEIGDAEWQLIRRMCDIDPKKRVSIGAVVAHLSSLVESLEGNTKFATGIVTTSKKSKNLVVARGNALLSLRNLAKSNNKNLSQHADNHVITIHVNRGKQSERREIDEICSMLSDDNSNLKTWAAAALDTLSWNNSVNKVIIAQAGCIPPLIALLLGKDEDQKTKAASALRNLAVDRSNKVTIANEGGITALIQLVDGGNAAQKENAAGGLLNLSANADNKVTIATEGGILPLVALTRDGTVFQKEKAAATLSNLAAVDSNRDKIEAAKGVPALVELARQGNIDQTTKALGALWNLSRSSNLQSSIADASGIPVLVALARNGTDEQKVSAVSTLWNVSATLNNVEKIARAGGIRVLVDLLRGGTDIQKERAAGVLGNLADIEEYRMAIVNDGGVPPLVALVRGGDDEQKANAAGALANLARNRINIAPIAKAKGIHPLVALLREGNDVQKVKAVVAIGNLARDDKTAEAIDDAGGIHSMLELVRNGNDAQKANSAAALKQISGLERNQVKIVDSGGISALLSLVRCGNEVQKKNAVGALVVLSLNPNGQTMIAAEKGIPSIVKLARDGNEASRTDAVGVLANLCQNKANSAIIAALGGIHILIALVRNGTDDQSERATIALSNMSNSNDLSLKIGEAGGIEAIVTLVVTGNNEQKISAVRALIYLYKMPKNRESIAAVRGIPVLMILARVGNRKQKENAAGALRQLSASWSNVEPLASLGIIPVLVSLLRGGSDFQIENALGALMNLTGMRANDMEVVAAGGLPILQSLAYEENELVQERAVSVLMNMSRSGACVVRPDNTG